MPVETDTMTNAAMSTKVMVSSVKNNLSMAVILLLVAAAINRYEKTGINRRNVSIKNTQCITVPPKRQSRTAMH